MKTLLGAGARAIHPLAWLAGSSPLGLPNTNLLLMAAERRLLFMHMALSSPSNQDPDGCELETFEGDKQPEVDPQPVFGEDLVACVQPVPLLIISGPTGVGKRHAVRQGLKMAGREVEVFILDWADERLRGDAVAVLTRLQPVVRAGHCLLVLWDFCVQRHAFSSTLQAIHLFQHGLQGRVYAFLELKPLRTRAKHLHPDVQQWWEAALSELHSRGFVHGNLGCFSIVCAQGLAPTPGLGSQASFDVEAAAAAVLEQRFTLDGTQQPVARHPADWCRPGEYCCPEVAAVHSLCVRLFSSHEDAVQYAAQHSSAQLADAFAAGVVLFEMVTGRKPGWDASTDKLKAGDVLALPKELQAVIIGLTHRDPCSRFTAIKALHLLTQKPAGGSFPGQGAFVVPSAAAEGLDMADAPGSRSQPAVDIMVQAEGAAELHPAASAPQDTSEAAVDTSDRVAQPALGDQLQAESAAEASPAEHMSPRRTCVRPDQEVAMPAWYTPEQALDLQQFQAGLLGDVSQDAIAVSAASGSDEGAAETFGSDAQPAGRSPVQTKNPAGASPAAEMGIAAWASGSDSQPAGEEHARFKIASEGSPAGQTPAGESGASQDQDQEDGASVPSDVSEADTMDVDRSECPVGAAAGAFSELPQVWRPATAGCPPSLIPGLSSPVNRREAASCYVRYDPLFAPKGQWSLFSSPKDAMGQWTIIALMSLAALRVTSLSDFAVDHLVVTDHLWADNSQLDGDYMCKLYKPEAGWGLYEDEEGWELCKELEGLQLAFQLGIPHVGWRLPGCGPSMTPRTRAGSRRMLPVRDGMAFLKQLKRNPVQEWLTPDLWSRLAERAAIQMLQGQPALHDDIGFFLTGFVGARAYHCFESPGEVFNVVQYSVKLYNTALAPPEAAFYKQELEVPDDFKAEAWALGALLLELLTGRTLTDMKANKQLLVDVVRDVPEEWRSTVAGLLEQEPIRRLTVPQAVMQLPPRLWLLWWQVSRQLVRRVPGTTAAARMCLLSTRLLQSKPLTPIQAPLLTADDGSSSSSLLLLPSMTNGPVQAIQARLCL
eukprot:jgi/Astpho2/282/fgenesh1_pg.00010_%23_45_t